MTLRTLAALVTVALVAPDVRAQPAAAQAEIMFRKGKKLLAEGKTTEACAAFDASQKLDPTISTLLNQANCRERNGQLATAWGLFLEAERQTRAASTDEQRQLHQVATTKASKLEPRLSTLTIAADAKAPGLEIRRDTDVVDPATWNQALPIDGGTYKITARAPGKVEWSTSVKIENEKDAKTVTVPALAEVKKSAPPPPAPPLPPPKPANDPVPAGPPWFCTESETANVGSCKPKRDQCEASRSTLSAKFSDLGPCYGAAVANCFRLGAELHCAPSDDICDALRTVAAKQARVKITPCMPKHGASEPDPPPPPPPKPKGPQWSCTESRSRTLGVCKPKREECDALRSAMVSRADDLSPCHDVELAECFVVDNQPHCAPDRVICNAMLYVARREQHDKTIGDCAKLPLRH